MSNGNETYKGDIFELLLETSEKKLKEKRARLLDPLEIDEFFEEGSISINERTCQGIECQLCIKACPTNALYWIDGRIGIIRDLCVYCGACVLCCIVDDCIKVSRKRSDDRIECFSKPRDVLILFKKINVKKRHKRAVSLFPNTETYLKRYRK